MSAARPRIVILGIDAANPDVLTQGCRDGTFPVLASLVERGAHGAIQNVEGFHIGSTWPSFYTGVGPAQHGFHYLVQLRTGTYQYERTADSGLVRRPPFWSALSGAGKRVAVLDVPLTTPDPELNGIQVVEWGGHDSAYGFCTAPASLSDELLGEFGAHPLGPVCDGVRSSAKDYRVFADALVRGVERKTEMSRALLAREPWDLFMQVFTESHCVGHQAWHLHDRRHPAYTADIVSAVGDPVLRVYQAIDRAIGEILADCGDACVLVFTAHGMDHWYGTQFLLPEILQRMGWAVPAAAAQEPARSLLYRGARSVWRGLPVGVREALRSRFPGRDGSPSLPTIGVDPARSRCFVQLNGLAVGGIRLNLMGREPDGQVRPGREAEELEQEIERELMAVVNGDTGRLLVRRVLRTRDHHWGKYLGALPDLLVEWDSEQVVGSASLAGGRGATVRAESPRLGRVEGTNLYGRSGENRPEGWFVALGAGTASGTEVGPVSLLDLAPTFGEVLGVPIPGVEGKRIVGVWPELGL